MSAAYSLLPSSSPPGTPSSHRHHRARRHASTTIEPLSEARFPTRNRRATVLVGILGLLAVFVLVDTFGTSDAALLVRSRNIVLQNFKDLSRQLGLARDPTPQRDLELLSDSTDAEDTLSNTSLPAQHSALLAATTLSSSATPGSSADRQAEVCPRTLLYKFAGSHGFASEYLIFLRVALLARRYKYGLYIDDSSWNYGRWSDYFQPIHNPCDAPADLRTMPRRQIKAHKDDPPLKQIHENPPSWTKSDHVIWSTRHLDYLDALLLAASVDQRDLERLHDDDILQFPPIRPLSANATVPEVFEEVFRKMSLEAQGLWILNAQMSSLVSEVQVGDPARGAKEPSIIGMHVRLGDKSLELSRYGAHVLPEPPKSNKELHSAWHKHVKVMKEAQQAQKSTHNGSDITISDEEVNAYMEAAASLGRSLVRHRGDSQTKPTLVIMSDDTTGEGLKRLSQHDNARKFNILAGLPSARDASPQEEPENSTARRVKRLDVSALLKRLFRRFPRKFKRPGFSESAFNAMDLDERIVRTRVFLRDLTYLARNADGLVFTGSSNVGRLLSLLAGTTRMQDGRLRSTDVRWFPTVRYM